MIPLQGLSAIDLSNPNGTISQAQSVAKGVVQLLGYSTGLTETDMENLSVKGIPVWVIVAMSAVAGAVAFARWAPEPWIGKVKMFGR